MLIFGLTISQYCRFVTRIPQYYMAAAVTVLAVFGTYSVQNSMSDVFVMMILGTSMYLASKIGISPAPVVLGLILGPIAESNLVEGKLIAQSGDGFIPFFMTGGINIVLISLCLMSIGYSIFTEFKRMKNARENNS